MHQIRYRLGLCPRPYCGSLQHSPDPLAGFEGPTSKGREERAGEGDRKGEGREGREKGSEGIGEGEGGEGEWGSPTHCFRLKSCTGVWHTLTISVTRRLNPNHIHTP